MNHIIFFKENHTAGLYMNSYGYKTFGKASTHRIQITANQFMNLDKKQDIYFPPRPIWQFLSAHFYDPADMLLEISDVFCAYQNIFLLANYFVIWKMQVTGHHYHTSHEWREFRHFSFKLDFIPLVTKSNSKWERFEKIYRKNKTLVEVLMYT